MLISFHDELVKNRSSIAEKKLRCNNIRSAIVDLLNEAASLHVNIKKTSVDTLIGKISWFITGKKIRRK